MLPGLTSFVPEAALTAFDNLEFIIRIVLAAALGAGAGGAVRYGVMVLFAAAVWPMVFAPLCHALEKRVY